MVIPFFHVVHDYKPSNSAIKSNQLNLNAALRQGPQSDPKRTMIPSIPKANNHQLQQPQTPVAAGAAVLGRDAAATHSAGDLVETPGGRGRKCHGEPYSLWYHSNI